ncbi:uncharacterized protein [Nicotiana tomentosiformis]|uniref:uncharacterized protein n=1 Tax=Nicotiana tomentosiformis TaxID=4098 RepID=UPI00388CC899
MVKVEAEEWKRNMDRLASEKKTARAQLTSIEVQLRAAKEKASVQAKTIEELQTQLSSAVSSQENLAKELEAAKSEVVVVKAEANKRVAQHKADAEAAQDQVRNLVEHMKGYKLDWCMTRSSGKELLPYEPEIKKQLRQLRKERKITETLEKVGQSSTKDMAGNGEDNVDLAAREVAQLREKAARDAEEAALRDAQIAYEEDRARRINQNQPLGANQFRNITPGAGRPLGDYARPVYNQGLSSVRPPQVAANNFE